jgi:hypothetical protein
MGIFADDKQQDEKIAALEDYVRSLTEAVQVNQVDLAECRIAIITLKAQVDEKVSAAEVDPSIVKLNEDLATAREELDKASAAASESWETLQKGVKDAFEKLGTSAQEAWDKIKKA